MIKFTIVPKVIPGEKCLAMNYRKKTGEIEHGVVLSVEASLKSDGTYTIQYRVLLDRKIVSSRTPWGRPIWLYVGDETIYPV